MEKTENGKVKVVGVRFRTAGKIYYFDPGDFELSRGKHVIVETARGLEYGFVVGPPMEVDEKDITQPLKAVIRISTEEDDIREKKNREREREAFWICREKIQRRGLDMKLIDAEYTFDNSKVLFYFTADGRVDFRELVKDLAGVFRTRIELRQVGVRDETKILGGYGSCGRPLCCHTWLSDFVPVSIKMAKEQNLSLNPTKISGVCGRLMCCLKYEEEAYEELNSTMPALGDYVVTSDGMRGEVSGINVLRQIAKVLVENGDEKELRDYSASEITVLRRKKGKRGGSHAQLAAEDSPEMLALLEDEARRSEKAAAAERENRGDKGGDKNDARPDRREKRGKKEPGGDRKAPEQGGERQMREPRGDKPFKGKKPGHGKNDKSRPGRENREGQGPREGQGGPEKKGSFGNDAGQS